MVDDLQATLAEQAAQKSAAAPPTTFAAPPADTGTRMSVDQFADTVKAKYPAYADVDNKTLVEKVLAKYPVYASKVNMDETAAAPTSPLAAPLPKRTIDHIEGGGVLGGIANAGISTVNAAANLGAGFGSNIGKSIFNIAELPFKATAKAMDFVAPGAKDENPLRPIIGGLESVKKGIYETPFEEKNQTLAGQAGNLAGEAAQFAAPASKINAASKVVGGVLENTPWIVKKLAQAGVESTGYGATQYAKSGGDAKSAGDVALTAGPLSFLGHVGMATFAKVVPQTVKENLAGFLGYTGKQNLKALVDDKKVIDSTKAMTTMLSEAKEKAIQVLDESGTAKKWDPNNTTLHEFAQAFRATKDKLYSAYDSAAKAAGDAGARFTQKDIGPIIDKLDGFIKNRSAPFANKASELKGDITKIFLENTPTGMKPIEPVAIQNFLQDLNHFVQSEPKTPAAKVVAETADMLREALDNKISSATGEKYKTLKLAYSQLKTMEPDLVKQLARMKNKQGLGLVDIVDGLSAIDLIQGVATANPNMVIRGAAIGAVKAYKKFSKNPEYALLRALRILNKGDESAGAALTPTASPMAAGPFTEATAPSHVVDLRKMVK